eukprot:TRINITY_DN24669_c0_g1_i1.p1 TRINITY_DN24669_c0_g1~~TRINITY_DN24669_c0_g1_i1.p1  ORF type:complete len:935 (+),score=245.07 TRINITY_DN24669_c0_g1_i1:70-2874(+)
MHSDGGGDGAGDGGVGDVGVLLPPITLHTGELRRYVAVPAAPSPSVCLTPSAPAHRRRKRTVRRERGGAPFRVVQHNYAATDSTARLWMESSLYERAALTSATTCCQMLFTTALRVTENLGSPNVLRTAACMLLYREVCGLFERYHSITDAVLTELAEAIFIPRGRTSVGGLPVCGASVSRRPSRRRSFLTDAVTMCSSRSCYGQGPDAAMVDAVRGSGFMRTTYFEAYLMLKRKMDEFEHKASHAEQHHGRQFRVLNLAVESWQTSFLTKVFLGWKRHVRTQQRLRVKYRTLFVSMVSKGRMNAAWRRWEQTVDDMKLRMAAEDVQAASRAAKGLTQKEQDLKGQINVIDRKLAKEEEKVAAATADTDAAREVLKKQEAALKEVHGDRASVDRLLEDMLGDLEGPGEDRVHRNSQQMLLIQHQAAEYSFLLTWANDLIEHAVMRDTAHGGRLPEDIRFPTYACNGKPHVYLVRAVAPVPCHLKWQDSLLEMEDPEQRAKGALEMAQQTLGVCHMLRPSDLTGGAQDLLHVFLVEMFSRFADLRPLGRVRAGLCTEKGAAVASPQSVVAVGESRFQHGALAADWSERWKRSTDANTDWARRQQMAASGLERALAAQARKGASREVMTAQQKLDRARFARVPDELIKELLPLPPPERAAVHDKVSNVLEVHFLFLDKVYKYYSQGGGKEESKSHRLFLPGLTKLCSDCKVLNKRCVTRSRLSEIFNRIRAAAVSPAVSPEAQPVEVGEDSPFLSPLQFAASLCHIASATPGDADLGDKLASFVAQDVAAFACGGRTDEFEDLLLSSAVGLSMHAHGDTLRRVFCFFVPSLPDQDSEPAMDADTWKSFVKAAGVLDGGFTEAEAWRVFDRAAGIVDQADAPEPAALTYREFCDALVALTCYKNPCPFDPIQQRIGQFVRGLVQQLQSKIKGLAAAV